MTYCLSQRRFEDQVETGASPGLSGPGVLPQPAGCPVGSAEELSPQNNSVEEGGYPCGTWRGVVYVVVLCTY